VLEIEGLAKAWPDFALDVSLGLSRGEIGALLGPSGSGKSTLLRIIAGLERADSGKVEVDGRNISALPPERRGIGMVFQDYALFPHMSVRRNIEYGPRMKRQPRETRAAKAEALAESFEIAELLERSPRSLSGGEQQRVALARALAADPAMILLDEPLSSLDAALRRRLRAEIGASLRKAGTTALLVTHDAEEAFAVADKIFLMRDGSIEAEGRPEGLFESPPSAWSAAFLGRGPVIEIMSMEARAAAPIARTGIGDFACARDPSKGQGPSPKGSKLFLFFPASAPRIVNGDAEAMPNRIDGTVLSSAFAGHCRRIALGCPMQAGNGAIKEMRLEIELPPSAAPRIGDRLKLEVSPDSCLVLPQFA
jgi:iron(III) transport system ATP-binding protein